MDKEEPKGQGPRIIAVPRAPICVKTALTRACERSVSGAENGAERPGNRVSGSGAVSGSARKRSRVG